MWFKTSRAVEQRDAAQRGVRLAQLRKTLAAALIDVQRGQYEQARRLTSDYYTDLRRQIGCTRTANGIFLMVSAKDSKPCSQNATN